MKIIFLTHSFSPNLGGIERTSEVLAEDFIGFGAEVRVLTWTKEKSDIDSNLTVIRNPGIKEIIKHFLWADVIFENNPCLRLSWPAVFFSKKHFITLHTWIEKSGATSLAYKLKSFWLKRADVVIAVSHKLKDSLFPSAEVIVNSYNHQAFKRLPEIRKTRDFVFLGRLVSDKGADMAIMLLSLLNKKKYQAGISNEFNLTIIGEGPERLQLESLCEKYELEEFIDFKGALTGKELNSSLNEHKYILVPSRWKEPFGLVALEGMACGCLPIVSDGGGLPEAVGDAGLIFKRNNLFSMYKKVKNLLDNPKIENRIRENFSGHLIKHTSDIVSKNYFNIISTVYKSDEKKQPNTITSHREC